MACGTSMSDSTPPSDSASVKSSRPGHERGRLGVAEAHHPAEAGPADVARAAVVPQHRDARRARGRVRAPCGGAASAARGARGSSRTARAPRRRRSARSAAAPPSPRPRSRRRPRPCRSGRRGTSSSSARRSRRRGSSGCWLAGVAKVLSTATSGCADAARAIAATPSTSMTSSVGFVGVSTQTRRVSGRIAAGDGVEVGLVDEVVGQPPARQHLVDEPVGPAVEVARQDDVRPGLGRDGEQPVLGRHAAGERDRAAALELPERALERRSRRVGRARVVVVPDVVARRRLGVGRRLVDRRDDRAGTSGRARGPRAPPACRTRRSPALTGRAPRAGPRA